MTYKLLLVSDWPEYREGNGWKTGDLWAKEVQANQQAVQQLCLLSPLGKGQPIKNARSLPPAVQVITYDEVRTNNALRELVSAFDVIQVSATRPLWRCYQQFRVVSMAKKLKKCVICGISSNRAKAAILNATGKSIFHTLKAIITAQSIRFAARKLALSSNGLYLTGAGLENEFGFGHPAVNIETAVWTSAEDILGENELTDKIETQGKNKTLNLCVAARLEPMKGIDIAIRALADLTSGCKGATTTLFIYGEGPERKNLERLSQKLNVKEKVFFMGVVPYGKPFFKEIRKHDLMLLTNRSDEQPRLIFDSFSQGVVPICPDTEVYAYLKMNKMFLYPQGDFKGLSKRIESFFDKKHLIEAIREVHGLAQWFTIEKTQAKREAWVSGLLMQNVK